MYLARSTDSLQDVAEVHHSLQAPLHFHVIETNSSSSSNSPTKSQDFQPIQMVDN